MGFSGANLGQAGQAGVFVVHRGLALGDGTILIPLMHFGGPAQGTCAIARETASGWVAIVGNDDAGVLHKESVEGIA